MGYFGRTVRLLLGGLIVMAPQCFGDAIYDVSIDTSSVSGSDGAIYLAFSPGLNADLASVSITSFGITPPGALSALPPVTDGGVTGALNNLPLTIDNSTGLNDYLNYLTFGTLISFEVDFNLPATLTGDSGSEFDFGLTASDGLSPILTSDPSGFIGSISYDNNAVFAANLLSDLGTITPVSSVPEPSSSPALIVCLAVAFRFRRKFAASREL